MSYEPNQQELQSVASLPGPERYRYLVEKIADWEEVWSIADENGYALMANDEGNELVPIWPARQFAAACCYDEWKDYKPYPIPIEQWIDKWLPGMEKDRRDVVAFPVPGNRGIVVSPERLKEDLSKALDQYE